MPEKSTIKSTIKRVGGYLHRIEPILDKSGEVVSYALKPIMVEFRWRDVVQITIGAAIMAIPVSLTEEAWVLGETLPSENIIMIAVLSVALTAMFVYFNFYRFTLKGYEFEFVKRALGTYIISLIVVGILLTLLDKCPWGEDNILAVRRIIIVAFPAAMAGTLSDLIK